MTYYPPYQCRHTVNQQADLVNIRNVDIGDIASIAQTGVTYECIALPSSNPSNWRLYGSGGGGGGGGPVDWANVTNKPATFPPSAHTHDWDEITDKPTVFAPEAHTHGSSEINNQSTLPGATVTAVLNGLGTTFVEVADVGVTVAPLESTPGGPRVPPQYIEFSAFEQNVVVADQAARLALTGTLSTIAFQENDDTAWIIAAGAAKSNPANWSLVNTVVSGVSSFRGRTGVVTPQAGDYSAGQITATPSGNLNEVTVQGQLNELEAEKLGASNLSTAAPAALGAAAAGTSTNISRADHVHAHGNQGGGTLHSVATTSAAGFMSAADKAKLDGIPTGGAGVASITMPAGSGLAPTGQPEANWGNPQTGNVSVTINPRRMARFAPTGAGALTPLQTQDFTILSCNGEPSAGSYLQINRIPLSNLLALSLTSVGNIGTNIAETFQIPVVGAAGVQSASLGVVFSARYIRQPRIEGAIESKQTRSDVAGVVNIPVYTLHNTYHYRLTGNATLTLPNAGGLAAGTCLSITIIIDQDGTGGRTLALTAPAGDTIIPSSGQGTPGATVSGIAIASGANKRTRIVLSRNQGETRWDMAIVYTEA